MKNWHKKIFLQKYKLRTGDKQHTAKGAGTPAPASNLGEVSADMRTPPTQLSNPCLSAPLLPYFLSFVHFVL